MSKFIKNSFSLLLVLVLILGVAGCGGTKEETQSGDKTSTDAQSQEAEVRDLGGRTIRFLANWEEPVKGNSDRENIYWAKKTEVEEKYNCKYEHIYLSDTTVYDTFISSILSGDPNADIISYKRNPYPAIRQGLFYDLSKLKEFDFSDDKWFKAVNEMGKVNGNQYLMFSNKFVALNLIFYNKDVFNQHSQPDLWTLQKEGKLTLDKLIEIATAISKATGTASMRGDMGAVTVHSLFAKANGVIPVEKVDNALDFKVNINSTKSVDAYNKAQQLITEGVLNNGLDSTSWTYSRSQFNAGQVPILMGSENIISHFSETDFEVGMCVMPTVDGDMVTVAEDIAWCAIPYNSKKPEDIALIWNQMTDVTFDVDYKVRYRDAVSEDGMELIEKLSEMQISQAIPVNCDVAAEVEDSATINSMISGAITPAQAMQTVEPLYTAALKEYLD